MDFQRTVAAFDDILMTPEETDWWPMLNQAAAFLGSSLRPVS